MALHTQWSPGLTVRGLEFGGWYTCILISSWEECGWNRALENHLFISPSLTICDICHRPNISGLKLSLQEIKFAEPFPLGQRTMNLDPRLVCSIYSSSHNWDFFCSLIFLF